MFDSVCQVTLSHFSKFKIIVGMSLPCFADIFFYAKKRMIFNSYCKLLRIYYVRRLSDSYRMNVRTSQKMLGIHLEMLSVISITIFFILYFFKLPSKSIISFLFGELLNIDYFFTFLGIDSQPWL